MDYTPIINGDRYCLMCRHVCPVERVTKREATSPHGWALLIASVQRGLIDWNEETVDTLYQCADCGLCQANCATDRPLPAAIVAARAAVVAQNAHPPAIRDLDARLRANDFGLPLLDFGEAVTHADQPTDMQYAIRNTQYGLYLGAGIDQPTIDSALSLLRAAGITPTPLGGGRPAGYLPYTVGLWDTARILARQTIDEIQESGSTELLTLSKEDAHSFLNVYPELEIPFPENVRVTEFTTWLAAALDAGTVQIEPRPLPGAVYHDPCHTPRQPGSSDAARAVIHALTGSAPGELFWRRRQAAPCGAIGGFLHTQPDLAARLAQARLADARAADARAILTDDPACAAHLLGHADGLPVHTLIALAAAQLTGEKSENRNQKSEPKTDF